MEKWILKFWEPHPEHNCKSHRDRPALAVLQKQEEEGEPVYNMRYYCLECLQKQLKRTPGLRVSRPPHISPK